MRLLRLFSAALAVAVLALLPFPASAAPGWVWPVAGPHVVSRPFAPGPTPYSPGHRGADLPGAPGAAVLAAGAGRVSYAGLLAGRGVVVVVHGTLRTTYEPVASAVRVGQEVAPGEQIGTLNPGHAGCPAAACLHWGLRRGEDYLDPVRLVEGGPVRLLPRAVPAAAPGPPGPVAVPPVTGWPELPPTAPPPVAAPPVDAPPFDAPPGVHPADPGARPADLSVPGPAAPGRSTALATTGAALLALAAADRAGRRRRR